MDELKLLLDAFDRNGRVNRLTLDTLTMDDLIHDDGGGGWNVGQHLADMVDFRQGWTSDVSPQHAESIPIVIDGESPIWLKVGSIEELQAAFDAGDAAVRDAVVAAVSEGRPFVKGYPSHPASFLTHTIVHDSHHRGQLLALLRRAGRAEDLRKDLEAKSWGVWKE